jgi:hypothetical protein
MTHRRKFLAGIGALASGSAAAMGTGAVSSITASRESNIANVSTDADGIIGMWSGMGDDTDVTTNEDGALKIDLSGRGDQGINIDSVYKLGEDLGGVSPSNLEQHQYAFAIQNNDNVAHKVSFSYDLTNDDWITRDSAPWQGGYEDTLMSIRGFPYAPEGDFGAGGASPLLNVPAEFPDTEGEGNISSALFRPGVTVPFQITVDTTGEQASVDDKLGGTLEFSVTTPDQS